MPSSAGPSLLAGLGATAVLALMMLISPAVGVAAVLVLFGFFLLALASFPARAAWQEGAGWRQDQPGGKRSAAQAINAAVALFFLVCAAASTVWGLEAHLEAAAVTFVLCLLGCAVLGLHFESAGWIDEARRAYRHVGWAPKLFVALVWLLVMAPQAVSAYDHEAIRSGRVWEPAVRTVVAIVPLGWLLWESRLLRTPRPGRADTP